MRKLVVSTIISLDGCYEGPDGDVMAVPMDDAFDAHNLARMRAASTLLYGRTTTRIVPRAGSHAAIGDLKAGEGKDILVFGSRVLWHDLLAAGLVDELHVVLGGAWSAAAPGRSTGQPTCDCSRAAPSAAPTT